MLLVTSAVLYLRAVSITGWCLSRWSLARSGSELRAVELEMLAFALCFLAVVRILCILSRGEVGLLSVCHLLNYPGINCDKGLLFLHYLSLKDPKDH